MQVCTNPGHQITQVTKFCMLAPNICGSSGWNLLHVTLLLPRSLRLLLEFGKICALMVLFLKVIYVQAVSELCKGSIPETFT